MAKLKSKRYRSRTTAANVARRKSRSKDKFKYRVKKLASGGWAVNKAGCQCKK